jgi:competence protein ComEC
MLSQKSKKGKKSWSAIVLIILITIAAYISNVFSEQDNGQKTSNVSGELKVHYLDVGQGDSIIIQQGSAAMIIDAGNPGDKGTIVRYIDSLGIKKFDFVVGTHVHADHIGSMDTVIKTYEIGKVYFPKQTSTTATFKRFVDAVSAKGLKLHVPVVGESFLLGEAVCTVMSPKGENYKNSNDYSIVIKIQFGNTAFIFTGDAEELSEREMLQGDLDLRANVLKVSHHGSKSSTTEEFLRSVNPEYAIISVGKDNRYGHPSEEVLYRLKNAGIKVYRTDEQGTIIIVSDGKEVTINK